MRGVGGKPAFVFDSLVEAIERLVQRQRDLFELVFRSLDGDAGGEIPRGHRGGCVADARDRGERPPCEEPSAQERHDECDEAARRSCARKRQDVPPRICQVASHQHHGAVCAGRRQLTMALSRRDAGAGGRWQWNVAGRTIDELALAVPDGVVRRRRGRDAVHLSIFAGKDEVEIAGRRGPQSLHESGGAGLETLVDVGHERAPEQVAEVAANVAITTARMRVYQISSRARSELSIDDVPSPRRVRIRSEPSFRRSAATCTSTTFERTSVSSL